MSLCKKKYLRMSDKEAEARLDRLIDFLDETGLGFFSMSEKTEGEQKYVQVIVDIRVTASGAEKKRQELIKSAEKM